MNTINTIRSPLVLFPFLCALALLQACGESRQSTAPEVALEAEPEAVAETGVSASATDAPTVADGEPATAGEEPATAGDQEPVVAAENTAEEEIDPDSLTYSGDIELQQYTVAWVGSGTLGGGTLTVDGKSRPFRITGLGVGGFGASAVEATGEVYNLPDAEAFPGTYGNARLGMTAGESGSGKLWLRNPDGVVIKLESEMRGLALSSGVDGLLFQWDDDEDSSVDQAIEGTGEVIGDGIEAGADAVEKGMGKVKGWLKKD